MSSLYLQMIAFIFISLVTCSVQSDVPDATLCTSWLFTDLACQMTSDTITCFAYDVCRLRFLVEPAASVIPPFLDLGISPDSNFNIILHLQAVEICSRCSLDIDGTAADWPLLDDNLAKEACSVNNLHDVAADEVGRESPADLVISCIAQPIAPLTTPHDLSVNVNKVRPNTLGYHLTQAETRLVIAVAYKSSHNIDRLEIIGSSFASSYQADLVTAPYKSTAAAKQARILKYAPAPLDKSIDDRDCVVVSSPTTQTAYSIKLDCSIAALTRLHVDKAGRQPAISSTILASPVPTAFKRDWVSWSTNTQATVLGPGRVTLISPASISGDPGLVSSPTATQVSPSGDQAAVPNSGVEEGGRTFMMGYLAVSVAVFVAALVS